MRARPLSAKPKSGSAGFTLFEALVSVALMSLIVASLSAVTGQWVPNWHRGFGNVQRLESFDLGLRRVVADLASAEFVTANGASKTPLFLGDALSVTLVRRAFGPDTSPHLELVNFAETADGRGFALVRTRAPFAPFAANVPIATQLHLADPVALIRAPFRVSFSFAGPDRSWRDSWRPRRAESPGVLPGRPSSNAWQDSHVRPCFPKRWLRPRCDPQGEKTRGRPGRGASCKPARPWSR